MYLDDGTCVEVLLSQIDYKNWEFRLNFPQNGPNYLQLVFRDEHGVEWKSRKWPISIHMTKSEVVQTCFLAVKVAEEHEMREQFLYRGLAIFGPHFDCDKLYRMAADDHSHAVRS